MPWTIKPIYGILSDGFPIYGLHRTYYILIAAIIGTSSWLILGIIPMLAAIAVLMMLLGNISLAVPEVMVDAANGSLHK
jgi:ABC-type multidrug transport system permease subunit